MALGKMNFSALLDYQILPGDLELSQSYATAAQKAIQAGSRTPGIIMGGEISVAVGLQIQISAGLAVMPNGDLCQFPQTNVVISAADASNPRIDRIELACSLTNNTTVLDVNGVQKVLDLTYVPAITVVKGTAAISPAAPAQTSSNLTLGFVRTSALQAQLLIGNVTQIPDAGFQASAFMLGSSYLRYNRSLAKMQFSHDGALWETVGSGGGAGGGGGAWNAPEGVAPIASEENGEKVFIFAKGESTQKLVLFIRVPSSYVAGRPASLYVGFYSPSNSGNQRLQSYSYLIKKNTDAVTSTTNVRSSTNLAVVNTVANQYREAVLDLSAADGTINSVPIAAGDLIRVELFRDSTDTDTDDIRFVPSATEVKFQ